MKTAYVKLSRLPVLTNYHPTVCIPSEKFGFPYLDMACAA